MIAPQGSSSNVEVDPSIRHAMDALNSLLIPGEQLQAYAIQHRLFALLHRRVIVGATTGRLIAVARRLLGGYDPTDVRWQDLHDADLNVGIEFVEWRIDDLVDAVSRGDADIGIGGNAVTPVLATRCMFSEAYLEETVGFIVKDYLRSRFETWESIHSAKDL